MTTPNKPSSFVPFIEPESAANTEFSPVYPYNHVTQTPSGHSFELDDTPTRERVRLQHRSGTFIEMHPNGDEVHKVYGDGYEITIKDKNILVQGNISITVLGDADVRIKGNKTEYIEGDFVQHIRGNYAQIVEKQISMTSQGDTNINCGGFLGGGLKVKTGDYMQLDGDLVQKGELVSDKILSNTRVDAGTGMSAGFLGFVTELGGVSVGFPVAIPEEINCAGPINSLVSVSAPLGSFGISSSILGTDIVNRLIYNLHNHIAPLGPTSPSLEEQIPT
jgi:hypothetical protein